jgi:hypothetical protein
MRCFKRLGERVMARAFERHVVELHVRVALLNRFTQLLLRPREVLSGVADTAILEVAHDTLRVVLQHDHVFVGCLA